MSNDTPKDDQHLVAVPSPDDAPVVAEGDTDEEPEKAVDPMTSGAIEEIDRLRLSELHGAVQIQNNAAVALQAELGRLEAQTEVVKLRHAEAGRIGQQKQDALRSLAEKIRLQYNIPETHAVQLQDGTVVPAAPQQPGVPPGTAPPGTMPQPE